MTERTVTGPPVRVAIVGCGATGSLLARVCRTRGYEVVAAVNRAGPKVGRDFGDLALDGPSGVLVRDDLAGALADSAPDVALIAVADFADEMREVWLGCLNGGVNVICAGTEASNLQLASPATAEAVDDTARRNGVTFLGGGNQDFLIIRAGTSLLGLCVEVRALAHERLMDADGSGRKAAELLGVGAEPSEPERVEGLPAGGRRPSVYEIFAHQIVADLGLTLERAVRSRSPCLAADPIWSAALGREIPQGTSIGIREVVELTTQEGIDVKLSVENRLLGPGEREQMVWRVDGDPPVVASIERASSLTTTAAQMVNRIPDVIVAPAGYLRIEQLPTVAFAGRRAAGSLHGL